MSQLKKSSFYITCDKLKQYIKERKSLPQIGGLTMNSAAQEPTRDSDATLELFPGTEFKKKQLPIFHKGGAVILDDVDACKAEDYTAMPTARRKSLQRFLQKRKDRINSTAPYSSKPEASSTFEDYDKKSWLGLALAT